MFNAISFVFNISGNLPLPKDNFLNYLDFHRANMQKKSEFLEQLKDLDMRPEI